MPTLDHEGVPLAYQIRGNGDPVLLILQRSGSRPALLLVNRNGRSLFFGRSASVRPSVVTFKAVRGPLPGPDSRDGQARRRNRLGLGHDHGNDTILIRDLGLRRVDVMR